MINFSDSFYQTMEMLVNGVKIGSFIIIILLVSLYLYLLTNYRKQYEEAKDNEDAETMKTIKNKINNLNTIRNVILILIAIGVMGALNVSRMRHSRGPIIR